jgi:hypothetical protein
VVARPKFWETGRVVLKIQLDHIVVMSGGRRVLRCICGRGSVCLMCLYRAITARSMFPFLYAFFRYSFNHIHKNGKGRVLCRKMFSNRSDYEICVRWPKGMDRCAFEDAMLIWAATNGIQAAVSAFQHVGYALGLIRSSQARQRASDPITASCLIAMTPPIWFHLCP